MKLEDERTPLLLLLEIWKEEHRVSEDETISPLKKNCHFVIYLEVDCTLQSIFFMVVAEPIKRLAPPPPPPLKGALPGERGERKKVPIVWREGGGGGEPL